MARLPTGSWLSLPVEVAHGRRAGPSLFLTAVVHGDELNGLEIIRRVMQKVYPAKLAGTLITVPVVNVFGFIGGSRYLPDRRDLNRSFPGSRTGSLASRLAYLVMREVVGNATHGIDLHTGSGHRTNVPQTRSNLDDPETQRLALAFGAPVTVHTLPAKGSLRRAATEQGRTVLLYEAGEALRFEEESIAAGVRGVWRVMTALGMHRRKPADHTPKTRVVRKSAWIRARRTGVLRLTARLGQAVEAGETLGVIADAFGSGATTVRAPSDGVVIGAMKLPLVHQGDAIVHVGA